MRRSGSELPDVELAAAAVPAECVVCGGMATVRLDPPRRTIDRGPDPEDPSFGLTAVLPDLTLCDAHHEATQTGGLAVGWCDDERCRVFGVAGEASPCGLPFSALKR